MAQNDCDWLKNAKAGDKVLLVNGSGFSRSVRVATVERTTATRVYVHGDGFQRAKGYVSWETQYHRYIQEATPEAVRKIEEEERERHEFAEVYQKLVRVRWRDFKAATLRRVLEVIEAAKET